MAEATSISTKRSVPCAEASSSVLVFSVSVTYTIFKQTLNYPIEDLEEEESRVKLQNSITLEVVTECGIQQPTRSSLQESSFGCKGCIFNQRSTKSRQPRLQRGQQWGRTMKHS